MGGVRRGTATALLAAVLIVPLALPAGAARGRDLRVMTRNLYLGADLNPLFAVTTVPGLLAAVASLYATVQATDFPARAEALAGEIDDERPDLVALQEAVVWRVGPFGDPAPATTVAYDFVGILMDQLAGRGLHYAPVVSVEGFDGEAPSALGFDVRLTDHDVILARTDLPASAFKVSNPRAANFATNFTIASPVLGPITVLRGWVSVDVKVRGKTFRLVGTHLETAAVPPVQVAQAAELLAGPADTPMPVVMLGDFNSAADGSTTATYANLLAAGFSDAWTAGAGFTCCQNETLSNAASALDERIDYILFRGDFSSEGARVVGDETFAAAPPLWPSDHAGVVADLRVHWTATPR